MQVFVVLSLSHLLLVCSLCCLCVEKLVGAAASAVPCGPGHGHDNQRLD